MSKFLCKGGSRTHMLPRMRFGWLTLAHSPDSAGDHAAIHE